MTLLGFPLGAWIGAHFFVSKADGMAGGVMVLWYGVLGSITLLIVGIVWGNKLKGRSRPILAVSSILIAIALYGNAIFKGQSNFKGQVGSELAYAEAGSFTASMERLDLSDPFLFVRMDIDSRSRKWIQTGPAPKHDTYTATIRAEQLVELREALNDVARMPTDVLNDCMGMHGVASKRLSWHIFDGKSKLDERRSRKNGFVDLNNACLHEYYPLSRAILLLEKASLSSTGDIERL